MVSKPIKTLELHYTMIQFLFLKSEDRLVQFFFVLMNFSSRVLPSSCPNLRSVSTCFRGKRPVPVRWRERRAITVPWWINSMVTCLTCPSCITKRMTIMLLSGVPLGCELFLMCATSWSALLRFALAVEVHALLQVSNILLAWMIQHGELWNSYWEFGLRLNGFNIWSKV